MDYRNAKKIMNCQNYFGPEEIVSHFGIEPESKLSQVPFSEELLNECRDTHFLFLTPSLSVNEFKILLRIKKLPELEGVISTKISPETERLFPLAFNANRSEWCLMTIKPIKEKLPWHNLIKILTMKREVIPTGSQIFYANVCNFLIKEERLFENISLRCSDSRTIQCNVRYRGVMKFIDDGFYMESRDENYPNSVAYVAAKTP